jgi:hypothetical protein
MNIHSLTILLSTTPEHFARLKSLQDMFARACNALAPVVKETKCWNRVALHHMMYKTLREQFPQLGSQMVCNAIYSVSRTSRLVFQSEQSPYNIQLFDNKPLPLLQFLPSAPVYFDRHTLSLKSGSLSMFTLDGRMRFEINLSTEDLARFKTMKLNEIILKSVVDQFALSFSFEGDNTHLKPSNSEFVDSQLPEYIVIDQTLAQDITAEESTNVDHLAAAVTAPKVQQKVIHLQLGSFSQQATTQQTQAVPTLVQVSPTHIQIDPKQSFPIAQASDMIQIKPPGDKL